MQLEISKQHILDMLNMFGVEETKNQLKAMWNIIVDENMQYYEDKIK